MSVYTWLCGGVGILLALVFVYALCRAAASADAHLDDAFRRWREGEE